MPWVLFGRRWLLVTLAVLALMALFVRLGVWQLDRLAQRRVSNAHIAQSIALPTVTLPSPEDLTRQEYRRVRVEGRYDFEHQLALRNQAWNGVYGFRLLTPLFLAGNAATPDGPAVLVDRGWIPAEGNEDPEAWRKYDVAGPVMIYGVVRLGHDTDAMLPGAADEPASRFALLVDTARASRQLGYGLLPFYVQAGGSDQGVPPIAEIPRQDLSDGPHLGYAVQWFGFALTLAIGYGFYVQRQEKSEV